MVGETRQVRKKANNSSPSLTSLLLMANALGYTGTLFAPYYGPNADLGCTTKGKP